MNLNLLKGRYTAAEAKQLVTALIRVKTDFHQQKIRDEHEHEEDIKHSERRIKELEAELRAALQAIGTGDRVDLHASIALKELVPLPA